MVTLVTRFVPTTFRTGLDLLDTHWRDVTRAAALERQRDLDRPALFVVATWLDERGGEHLRTWLRPSLSPLQPIALAVGAHPESDVGPIHGASLRHALVLADPLIRPNVIDVIDLRSGTGLRVAGRAERRLHACGSVRFGVGSGELLAIVLARGETLDAAFLRTRGAPPRAALTHDLRFRELAARCEVSICMPRPLTLLDQAPVDPGRLVLRPSTDELRDGFLIGRDPRCSGQSADALTSRVHAFVQQRGDSLLIADVGSTNGTTVVDDGVPTDLGYGRRAIVSGVRTRLLVGHSEIELVTPSAPDREGHGR